MSETNSEIQSKVLILENSDQAISALKEFFQKKSLIGLKCQAKSVVELLSSNTDLGAVFLSEDTDDDAMPGIAIAEQIAQLRPELPIFLRKNSSASSELDNAPHCNCYSLDNLQKLDSLLTENLFSRYYPMKLVSGIQEISRESIENSFLECTVECDAPYLVKDNVIYGELFSLIPIESNWCRGYMMLQSTKQEVIELIKCGKTHLPKDNFSLNDVNSLFNEITNLIWGGMRSRFMQPVEADDGHARVQVPIIVNHNDKYISFGTSEPQLCFRHVISGKPDIEPVVIYQKLIFNLAWRPEDYKEDDNIDDLVDSGELEFF